MKRFLIVGRVFPALKKAITNRGDSYLIVKDIKLQTNQMPASHTFFADFSSKETLLRDVNKINDKPDAVIAVYESYILPAAWIAESLKLPGLPVAAAEACTDKFLMRQKFSKAEPNIRPDFMSVDSKADLLSFAKTHGFPLVLKPANLQKSLFVTTNYSLEELLNNYRQTIASLPSIYKKLGNYRQPKIIVEEFIKGSIHSVDVFVDSKGRPQVLDQIVDYKTGYDIGYQDNFHYSRVLPSALSQTDQLSIKSAAAAGCKALGMASSPAHVEIILSPDGPKIVEIGARNGGYRERMHRLANGLEIYDLALDTALDKPIIIKAGKNDYCAVLELFPKTPGVFTGVKNQSILLELASLNYFAIKQPLGKHVGKSADGYKMCAIIILYNANKREFMKDLEFVNKKVSVLTA